MTVLHIFACWLFHEAFLLGYYWDTSSHIGTHGPAVLETAAGLFYLPCTLVKFLSDS